MSPTMAPRTDSEQQAIARTGRTVALVIAVTMLSWLVLQWLGGRIGLDPSLAFLFDLAALAAFFWSLVVLVQLWQRQKRAGR